MSINWTNKLGPKPTDTDQPTSEGLDDAACWPSDFVRAGSPACSILGRAQMEHAALAIMAARSVLGDEWGIYTYTAE